MAAVAWCQRRMPPTRRIVRHWGRRIECSAREGSVRVPDMPLLPCASRPKVQYGGRSGRASTRMSGAKLRLAGDFLQR